MKLRSRSSIRLELRNRENKSDKWKRGIQNEKKSENGNGNEKQPNNKREFSFQSLTFLQLMLMMILIYYYYIIINYYSPCAGIHFCNKKLGDSDLVIDD